MIAVHWIVIESPFRVILLIGTCQADIYYHSWLLRFLLLHKNNHFFQIYTSFFRIRVDNGTNLYGRNNNKNAVYYKSLDHFKRIQMNFILQDIHYYDECRNLSSDSCYLDTIPFCKIKNEYSKMSFILVFL